MNALVAIGGVIGGLYLWSKKKKTAAVAAPPAHILAPSTPVMSGTPTVSNVATTPAKPTVPVISASIMAQVPTAAVPQAATSVAAAVEVAMAQSQPAPAVPANISPGSNSLVVAAAQTWASDADLDPYTHPTTDTVAQVVAMYKANPNAVIMGYFGGYGAGLQPAYAVNWLKANAQDVLFSLPPPKGFASWQAVYPVYSQAEMDVLTSN